jgi:hypothetical protein
MTSRCKWNVRFVQKIIRLHDHHVTIKGGVSCLPTLNLICHCKEYKHYGMPCPVNHVARCSNLTWTLDKAHNGLIQHQTILFYESNGAWAYLWGNTDKAHNDRTDHVDVHLCFTNGSVVWMGVRKLAGSPMSPYSLGKSGLLLQLIDLFASFATM